MRMEEGQEDEVNNDDNQIMESRSTTNCSITDLLALRFQSVPFDFNEVVPPSPPPIVVGEGNKEKKIELNGLINHVGSNDQNRLIPTRWVPLSVTISYVGTLNSIPQLQDQSSSSSRIDSIQFNTQIPTTTIIHTLTHHQFIPISLFLIPSITLVKGQLPHPTSNLENLQTNWLISGELCIISEELVIIAQSLYELGLNMMELHFQNINTNTNQVSFTGMISSVIPIEDRYRWTYDKNYNNNNNGWIDDHSDQDSTMDQMMIPTTAPGTTITSTEDLIDEIIDSDRWYSAEEYCKDQDQNGGGVSLADLEWIEISIEMGEKDSNLEDLRSWCYGKSHLISVKCRRPLLSSHPSSNQDPSLTQNQLHDDRHRLIHYATPLPIVGQLIGIRKSSEYESITLFVQL